MRRKMFLLWGIVMVMVLFLSLAFSYENEVRSAAGTLAQFVRESGKKTVAVVDFTDLQGNVMELGRFLAEELSIALSSLAQKDFRVMDRTHLRALLKEHQLSLSGLIDPSTARKVGELSGVDALVTGTLTPFGDNVRLALKVIELSTAEILGSASVNIGRTQAINELLSREVAQGAPTLGEQASQQGFEGTYVSADGEETMEFWQNGEVYIKPSDFESTLFGKYELREKQLIVKVEFLGIPIVYKFTIEGDRIVAEDGEVYIRKSAAVSPSATASPSDERPQRTIKSTVFYPREEIEIIEQYLVLGEEAQFHLTYRNIGSRTLRVWLKISWFYDPLKTGSWGWFAQLDERGPIPPQGKEELVYTLLPKFPPQHIMDCMLQIGTYGWEEAVFEPWKGEEWGFQILPYPWFHPDVDPIVKPTRVIETSEPPAGLSSTIEIANLSFAELSALAQGIDEAIQRDTEKGRLRETLGARAQLIAFETEILAQYFHERYYHEVDPFAYIMQEFDRKISYLRRFFGEKLPDLTFGISTPEDVTVSQLDTGDEIIIKAIVESAKVFCNRTIPFLSDIAIFAVERLRKILVQTFDWKEVAYVEVEKPKIGTMKILYDKKTKTAWVVIDLEDLPEKYGFKNEGLDMYIPFDPEPPKLRGTEETYDYRIIIRESPVMEDIS